MTSLVALGRSDRGLERSGDLMEEPVRSASKECFDMAAQGCISGWESLPVGGHGENPVGCAEDVTRFGEGANFLGQGSGGIFCEKTADLRTGDRNLSQTIVALAISGASLNDHPQSRQKLRSSVGFGSPTLDIAGRAEKGSPMKTARQLFTLLFLSCYCAFAESELSPDNTFTIAFGSCGSQDHPLPIFHDVVKHQPDVFIFLGDNIYGDTEDMDVLRQKYQKLGSKPSYQNLKKHTDILATWDDHDYGQNDVGKHYPHKEASKEIFLKFFEEPKDSARYQHEGIYHSVFRRVGDKIIQIILLDGRTFRDDLLKESDQTDKAKRYFYHLDYAPHTDPSKAFLGEQQWAWLENELRKPADFRIIASGTQFGIEYNGYESWANYPHEQERMVQLIKKTRANHLVFISGDVHYAELSKFAHPDSYPLYDITASGLSQTWRFATPNRNRIEGPIMDNNFGLLTINFLDDRSNMVAEVWDIRENQRIEYVIPFDEIRFTKD